MSLNWQCFNRSMSLLFTIPGEKLQSCSIRPGEAVVHRRFDRDSTDYGSFILCTFLFASPQLHKNSTIL